MSDPNSMPTPEEPRAASASAERAVAVGGSVSQSVIATGDNAVITVVAGQGVQELTSYWNAVRELAAFPLRPSVFTASREEERAAVRNWLAAPPGSLFMRTHGLTEGLDFLAALGEIENNERLRRAVIVPTNEAWRQLTASSEPRVLIADPA